MYNSRHFTHRKNRQLRTTNISVQDLKKLGLDRERRDQEEAGEFDAATPHSSEFIPQWLTYNDAEEWYWRYGFETLYRPLFEQAGSGREPQIQWRELHRFLTAFAWIEPQWRFILDKPCWPFHTEVVDRIVSLYLGVKHYETVRAKAGSREHVDYREMVRYFATEVKAAVKKCKIVEAKAEDGSDPPRKVCCVEHQSNLSTKRWVESLLHRVIEFEGHLLPSTPVMYSIFPKADIDESEPGTDTSGDDASEEDAWEERERDEEAESNFGKVMSDLDLFFIAENDMQKDSNANEGTDADGGKEDRNEG